MSSQRHPLALSFVGAALAISLSACATTQEASTAQVDNASATSAESASTSMEANIDPALALELQRLEYALRSLERAQARWPWLSTDETCIVLNRLTEQYLFMCEPSEGSPFEPTGATFRGRSVYRNGTELAAVGPQRAPHSVVVQSIVGTVLLYHPANEALTSFAKERPYIFITSLDALSEAHPAFSSSSTTEEWLSIFVHEYFHTRQFLHERANALWGNMLQQKVGPGPLIASYEGDEDFRAAVDAEYELLAETVRSRPSKEQAKAALARWLSMRNERVAKFSARYSEKFPGHDLDTDDLSMLYIEGIARYFESVYLVDPTYHVPDVAIDEPRFTRFSAFAGKGYDGMISTTIPQGRYFYAFGLHVGMLLDVVDESWTKTLHEQPRWVLDAVKARTEP